jgi:hypothetical protein
MYSELLFEKTSCVNTTVLSFVLTQKKQKVKQEHIIPTLPKMLRSSGQVRPGSSTPMFLHRP